ncbi:uncharacterized protein [Haliotis asinina]|uniref:uncharacterized protein n=1 Tax=Haliotis asinina TaxID=109174 RepID=UPI003531F9D5
MDKCKSCQQTEEEYKQKNLNESVLLEHVSRATVTSKKTPQKERTLRQLAKAANALLNSDGGVLLIHVCGQQQWDRDLELLDEAIGKRFSTMLPSGCQYSDYFSRKWLSNVSCFERFQDFLLFRITKIHGVSTLDTKTKMRNDFENVNAPCSVIATILRRGGDNEDQVAANMVRHTSLVDIPLHEDRESELKSLPQQAHGEKAVEDVTDWIWHDLKLKDNITSMSKLQKGGRFYIGISEEPFNKRDYKTKTRYMNAFNFCVDINELIQRLYNKLKTDMIVLTGKGSFQEAPSDLIDVYAILEHCTDKYVLCVNINHFNGIVFHDKDGPEVYTFQNGTACCMSKEEWLHRLLSFCHQPMWPYRPQAVDAFRNMDSYRPSSSKLICDRPTFTADGQGSSTEAIKMVLLGSSGSGKSLTGNNILNREIFHTGVSSRSKTGQCQKGVAERYGREIHIIDTPGMFGTSMTTEEIAREVARCVWLTVPGIHAFVLVIKIDRFTEEVQTTVDLLSQIFGDVMMKYLIILFTRKDDLIRDSLTVEEFIAESPGELKRLVIACQNRFVVFNNRSESEQDRNQDVQSLLRAVDNMIVDNKGRCYNNWMHLSAGRIMKEREEQLRLRHMMEVQERKDSMKREWKKKHEKTKAEMSEKLAQLQNWLQDLKQERLSDSTGSSEIHALQQDIRDYKMMIERHQMQYEEEVSKQEREIEAAMNLHFRVEIQKEVEMCANGNVSVLEAGLKTFVTIALSSMQG